MAGILHQFIAVWNYGAVIFTSSNQANLSAIYSVPVKFIWRTFYILWCQFISRYKTNVMVSICLTVLNDKCRLVGVNRIRALYLYKRTGAVSEPYIRLCAVFRKCALNLELAILVVVTSR